MILSFIRSRYKRWVDKRYLKKHHCRSWEQYNHVYDEGRNVKADNLTDYYCGYNAIVHVRWAIVSNLPSWHDPLMPQPYELVNWCKEHCTDDFRLDDIKGKFINSRFVISHLSEFVPHWNAIPTEVFIAFKSEKDALLFKLRWI
jgi:hypothetical protein